MKKMIIVVLMVVCLVMCAGCSLTQSHLTVTRFDGDQVYVYEYIDKELVNETVFQYVDWIENRAN